MWWTLEPSEWLVHAHSIGRWIVSMQRTGRGSWILVPSYLIIMTFEAVGALLLKQRWTNGEAWPNIMSSLVGLAINAMVALLVGLVFQFVYSHLRILTLPLTLWGFVAAFLFFELYHYAAHRLGHRVGLFWAVHSVHHSSNEMNTAVASRILWGVALTEPFMFLLPLFGVSLLQFGVIALLTNITGTINHTVTIPRLGILDHIFMTPSNHRVHHGSQARYLDTNYGQTILFFDKLFGTHRLEEEQPDYGLVERDLSRNPLQFQTAGFRKLFTAMASAKRWDDKIRYLFKPPGWSHLGPGTTTQEIRDKVLFAQDAA